MIEHVQRAVLAGILRAPEGRGLDRYLHAKGKLTDDHFTSYEKGAWMLLTRLMHATGCIPTYAIIDHYLPSASISLEAQGEIRSLWVQLEAALPSEESDFAYAVFAVHEERKRDLLAQGLAQAGEILTFGKEIGRQHYEGFEDSRRFLEDQMLRIDGMARDSMPEGNIRNERDDLLDAYRSTAMQHIATGLVPLDRLTGGGFGAGELWLLAGFTNSGKSMLGVNIAHHMMMLGKNVVYLTTETLRPIVSLRTVIRHSRLEHLGIPGGLSYTALKTDEQSPEQMAAWSRVVHDFTGPESPYGRFDLIQVAEGTPMSFIRSKLRAYQAAFHVDAVVIDELQMIAAANHHERDRERLNDVIRSAKQLAVDFDGGRGIPVISPWQVNQAAWEAARVNGGRYTLTSLSETAEAARRADGVLSIFLHPDSTHRMSAQLLKYRDGATGDFEMQVEYDRCYIGAQHSHGDGVLPPLQVD